MDPPAGRWVVRCRLVDDGTTATAKPALAVAITDGVESMDVGHVALNRRQGKNKDVALDKQLQHVIDAAQEAATTINEFEQYLDELRAEAAEMASKRVRLMIGKVTLVPT